MTLPRSLLRPLRVALCVCGLLACGASGARAQVIWAGGTGNWNDPINNLLNWGLLGLLPGISHTVTINSGVVSLNVSSDIAGLTIGSGGGLTILSGQSLTLQSPIGGGTLANSASIQLASTGSDTKLIVKGGPLMLSGGGSLTLGNNTHNIVTGHLGTEQFINESTIQGAGQLGAGMLAITNNGTISANQSTAMVIQPNAGGLTNTGIIRATGGGTLTFSGGDITNFGGNVTAETGSTVNFSTIAGLAGGNVTTSGTGTINLTNSFLNSAAITNNAGGTITINGPENGIAGSYVGAAGSTLSIADNSTLFLGAGTTVTLNGSLILASGGNDTTLWFGTGATSVTGAGTITLMDNASRVRGSESMLTLGSGITLQGAGQIGSSLILTNLGTLLANSEGWALEVKLEGSTMTNSGLMRALDFGELVLHDGNVNNTGGVIDAQSFSNVTLRGAHVSGGTLSSSGSGYIEARTLELTPSALSSLTIAAGTLVEVPDGHTLRLNGVITNHGTLQLSGFETNTDLEIASATTLSGTGQVAFTNFANNRITGSSLLINDTNHLIRGAGQIGTGALSLENRGVIKADIGGATLFISPTSSGTGLVNSGDLLARDGGILRLQNAAVTNTGGLIQAESGSLLEFGSVTIQGGTIGGAVSLVASSTFRSLDLEPGAYVTIANNTALSIGGTIQGSSMIQLNASGGNTADLIVESGGATISSVVVSLSNNASNTISGATAASTLTNNGYIVGGGKVGNGSLTLVNNGSITATTSTPLVINVTNSGGFTNGGMLAATSGDLTVAHGFASNGTIAASSGRTFTTAGTLNVTGGLVSLNSGTLASAALQTQSGTYLLGSGTVTGPVSAGGIVAPGTSGSSSGAATLTFTGPLTLTATSMLLLELAGPAVHDQIAVQSATLGGILGLVFSDGFQSSIVPSQSFTLITAATSLAGTFSNISGGRVTTLDGYGTFQVNLTATTLSITDFAAIPEPSTYALLSVGAAALALSARRRRRRDS